MGGPRVLLPFARRFAVLAGLPAGGSEVSEPDAGQEAAPSLTGAQAIASAGGAHPAAGFQH